jgi:hypothetical protein
MKKTILILAALASLTIATHVQAYCGWQFDVSTAFNFSWDVFDYDKGTGIGTGYFAFFLPGESMYTSRSSTDDFHSYYLWVCGDSIDVFRHLDTNREVFPLGPAWQPARVIGSIPD